MKFIKSATASRTLGLAALAVLASPLATAEERGWFIGTNLGQSRANLDEELITNGLQDEGFTTTAYRESEKHFAYKIFGGYQFNKYFALEGGYFDLGNFEFTADVAPPGIVTGEIEIQGVNLDAVVFWPFTEKFAAFARAGANYAETKDTFGGTGFANVLTPNYEEKETNFKFGGGLQYKFTHAFAMRLEAERFRIDDAVGNKGDIDFYSVGFLWRFFAKDAPYVAAPAPAMAPAPATVVVPVAEQTQQYCSILDLQFEVNRDEIELEDKEKLGVVGTFLAKYPETSAVIEGHTDNIGTPADNMKLSQRRAESVVTYLKNDFRITSSRLSAVGYGDTRPIADNSTEEGKRQNRRIGAVVACASDTAGLAVTPARMTMALVMEFDQNKADVKPEYRNDLEKVANFLKSNPGANAVVEGHTANLQPTHEKALAISRQRAQNVVTYLVDNFGIERSRLTAEGFGETRRTAYNTSAEGRQENRRVNIVITYPK